MPTEIILPKVDMDMATGKISRWYVAEGGEVKKGDVLFEIETDKAAMEIDAPVSGILRDISGKEGIDIAVGSRVAMIYEPGEATAAPVAEQPAAASEPATVSASVQPTTVVALQPSASPAGTAGIRATPLARRIGREQGIDLSHISGSGPHGRILRADVEAFSKGREEKPVCAAKAAPISATQVPAAGAENVLKLFAEGTYDVVPHDTMRRTIARRLVEAKSTVPHFYIKAVCEIDDLMALRAKLNASAPTTDGKPEYKLSLNDMVIKAMALALRAVPDANVSWTDEAMIRHKQVDIGVAVSVPGGLITPIIRHAEKKTLSAISNEMKDLAERARTRKLKAEEYQGGTAAISNLGMFGVEEFAAIINPPHASILAVGAGERRAVVRGETVVPATVMTVTLSTDHRAVDGALAAQLIGAFRRYVENPYQLFV